VLQPAQHPRSRGTVSFPGGALGDLDRGGGSILIKLCLGHCFFPKGEIVLGGPGDQRGWGGGGGALGGPLRNKHWFRGRVFVLSGAGGVDFFHASKKGGGGGGRLLRRNGGKLYVEFFFSFGPSVTPFFVFCDAGGGGAEGAKKRGMPKLGGVPKKGGPFSGEKKVRKKNPGKFFLDLFLGGWFRGGPPPPPSHPHPPGWGGPRFVF